MRFDGKFFFSIFPDLLLKVPYTLLLGCLAFIVAFFIGLVIELMYTSNNKASHYLAAIYISYFRSTPYIMQLFIFFYGLPQVIYILRGFPPAKTLVITIAMNSAAFIAEIIRGGLQSVDKGQREAALSIGMSKFNVYKEIILPQAFVSAFPSLGNAFISMIKNTAIGFTIGVVELMSQAKLLAGVALKFMEAYIAAGIVYWIFLVVVDKLLKKVERKISVYQ